MNLTYRREFVFLIIAALFLGSLAMMNILGITRFIDFSFSCFGHNVSMLVPIGVLPYPLTFLCTDLICEFYGKKRANLLVFAGLLTNIWIFFVLWVAGILPTVPDLESSTMLPAMDDPQFAFYKIRIYALGAIFSSMIAYLVAQFLDVYLYEFWRKLTKGKHLWLRNNGSTLISQLVDTVIVISIAYFLVKGFPVNDGGTLKTVMTVIWSSYIFKAAAAVIDTLPFYLIVHHLKRYLQVEHSDKPLKIFTI